MLYWVSPVLKSGNFCAETELAKNLKFGSHGGCKNIDMLHVYLSNGAI